MYSPPFPLRVKGNYAVKNNASKDSLIHIIINGIKLDYRIREQCGKNDVIQIISSETKVACKIRGLSNKTASYI